MLPIRAVILLSAIYQTCGAANLALNKPAFQSGDFVNSSIGALTADLAVNGIQSDFSHTATEQDENWWMVDLGTKYSIESVTLYNRFNFYNQLVRVSILTSNATTSPGVPQISSNDWTLVNYQEHAYGAVGNINFSVPVEGQHVAVITDNPQGLALAEVEVYEYNYALDKPAVQQSHDGNAQLVVDGDLTITPYSPDGHDNLWWKVDLEQAIIFREVEVYASSRWYYLARVYFLTNSDETTITPNTAGSGGWDKCYYSYYAVGYQYTVQCDQGYQNPLTRQFSIYSSYNGGAWMREVEIYGYELPQLSSDIDVKADTVTTTNVTVSFIPWNQLMTGGYPPTEYTVEVIDGESKTLAHIFDSARLSKTFNGLHVGQTYTFTVSCTIQGIACNGSTHSFTAFTLCSVPPAAPGEISLSAIKGQNSNRQRWIYTATWEASDSAVCSVGVQYQCNIDGQITALQTTTTAVFYLDGDLPFEFIVKAKNSVGFSTPRSKSEISGVLKPQFSVGQISVTGRNTSCVTVTWESPQYPGGTISQYQYRCQDEMWKVILDQVRSIDSCGYEANTNITCRVRAKNSAGFGLINSQGKTQCSEPSAPQSFSLTSLRRNRHGRQRWKLTAIWQAPIKPNCDDTIQYKYGIQGVITSTLQSRRTAAFFLDGDRSYELIVKAKNSVGYSASLSKSGRSDPLAPQFGSATFTVVSTSTSCVMLSWEVPQYPGGDIIGYKHQCNDTETKTEMPETFTAQHCGYSPYTKVMCTLEAINSAGNGGLTASIRTSCSEPSSPNFSLASYRGGEGTTSLNVTLLESTAFCEKIDSYIILVRHPNGSVVRNQTVPTSGNYTINNLNGYTNYAVTTEAVNNKGLRSESTRYITTVETPPADGPIISLSFTVDCALLYLLPPKIANGRIISYQYQCAESGDIITNPQTISILEVTSGVKPNVCQFPQATKIVCEATAVNGAGESPKSIVSGYTNAAVLSSEGPSMLSPAETNSHLVVINVLPVELQDPTLNISSYLLLLRNRTSAEVKRSIEDKCDVDRENCITIASIDSELVTADGYWFYIGDGKLYGGYLNSALVPKSSYSVQIAISVQLPGGGVQFYQNLAEELTFLAPSKYCPPPPAIENAIAGSSSNVTIDEDVLYACEDGYRKISGDSLLTCTLSDSYQSFWFGSLLQCGKELKVAEWAGIAGGVGAFVIAVAALIGLVIWKLRNRPGDDAVAASAQSTEMNEYRQSSTAGISQYEKLRFTQEANPVKPVPQRVYDDVPMEPKPQVSYENVSLGGLRFDEVYSLADS